jgi:hypothetical protein
MLSKVDRLILRDELRGSFHVGSRQLVALAHQRRQLPDDTIDILRPWLVTVDQEFMSLCPDSDVEA